MLIFFLAALAAGAARCIIPVYNYHPLLVNGVIHSGILVSVLVVMHFVKKIECMCWWTICMVGVLPVHLAINFAIIGNLAQLMDVSHILLNFLSLP